MAFERFTRDTDNIESLSDRPNQNEGLSATQLKRRFDQVGVDLAEFVNNHLNELESSEEGESGADSIGVTPIKDGGADTLQTVLGELKADQVGADSSAVHKTGDETIAGAKTFNAKAVFKAGLQYSTESKDSLGKGDDNMTVLSAVGGGKESYVVIVPETDSAGKDILFVSARNDAAMKKVWHSGNDGAGSGLDADKLDGAEGADFVKKAGSETITGDKTFTGDVVVQTPSGNTNPATKKYVDDKDALVVHLAGSETVTGDKIFSGAINVPPAASGAHAVNKTYLETNVYTKTNLQTSGSAQVHWGNLTNVPPLGDEHWKSVVANRAALPLEGNKLGDNRMVLDDGDGKQAVYTCIATTGDVDAQWAKIGDVDWVSEEQTRIDNENARIAAEGSGDPKSGRIGAEIDRVSAEEARALAEGGASPKSGRVGAELDREDAESARASAESNRETAEGSASPRSGRIGAELDRVDAEALRVIAEGDALSGRVKAEADRVDAEALRVIAEGDSTSGRVKAEADRVDAEALRVIAEGDALSGRVKAELDRANAEAARSVFETYNSATAYVVGNKVVYNDSAYVSIQNGTGKTPSTEPTYWLLIASGPIITITRW